MASLDTENPMDDRSRDAPLIGITVDNRDNSAASGRYESSIAYSRAVAQAGGAPALLPHEPALAATYVARLDGLLLTGGVDPDTSAFGEPMHAKARPIDARRQAFELALLDAAAQRPDLPVLGVCLGMQLMALHAGGRLNQYLSDTLADAQVHQNDNRHALRLVADDSILNDVCDAQASRESGIGNRESGDVVSYHRQAVDAPGRMRVIAIAPDEVIEAIDLPTSARRFYLGVQWHPERGGAGPFNAGLFETFVSVCRARTSPPALHCDRPTTSARA